MKKEDFERLKAVCEKEGFWVDDNHSLGLFHIMVKDIWDGVEFALIDGVPENIVYKNGKIVKISRCQEIPMLNPSWAKPSTEQAYIDQLKKECFGMHNDKLESSKIDDSNMHGGRIRFEAGQGDSFQYRKDTDTLYWCGIPVYQAGKLATRVKERVKVEYEMASTSGKNYLNLSYKVSRDIKGKEIAEIALFLASQLEKYLNGEVE